MIEFVCLIWGWKRAAKDAPSNRTIIIPWIAQIGIVFLVLFLPSDQPVSTAGA
jgi:hypothetical protein